MRRMSETGSSRAKLAEIDEYPTNRFSFHRNDNTTLVDNQGHTRTRRTSSYTRYRGALYVKHYVRTIYWPLMLIENLTAPARISLSGLLSFVYN